jgi:phosphate transport system protein
VNEPLRRRFTEELEQLGLQVEVLFVRVDENLERMRTVLRTGDLQLADAALAADDEIDAMSVSLTERCYEVLAREGPVAGDLRMIVSVMRVLNELERVGDLALRVVNLVRAGAHLSADPRIFDILQVMADFAIDRYRAVMRAWAANDLDLATEVVDGAAAMDVYSEQLIGSILTLGGPDAAREAIDAFHAGRALERIADHAVIIAARIQYLITGEPQHLQAEVR